MNDQERFDAGVEAMRQAFVSARLLRELRDTISSADIEAGPLSDADKNLQRAIGAMTVELDRAGKRIGKSTDEVHQIVYALEADAETRDLPDDMDD